MTTNTISKTKTIAIDPSAPYAGISLVLLGAMLFGFGVGVTTAVPIFFGMGMLLLGLFIMVGLLKANMEATHRKD